MARSRSIAVCLLASLALGTSAHAQTGLVPLTDLGAGFYQGYQGGLYPGGSNAPPVTHLAAALARAAQIVPRNSAGTPDPQGFIALIAVGMSNTTHEFGAFERNEDLNAARNARVVLMDTGFGGQTASIIASPAADYWTTMSQRLTAMGLSAAQVQVAWLKEAEAGPPNNFPIHAQAFRESLERVVQNLHDKFPNLRICYLSSRIYGGYSTPGSISPEPQAYECGFATRWLIEDQINGDPGLNHDPLAGTVRAPLLLWGPYLWADGPQPRSDGLVWLLGDLENDRIHPSPAGEQKVAGLLSAFFPADATTAPWWPEQPGTRLLKVASTHDAHVSAASPGTNFGASALLVSQGGSSPSRIYLTFDVRGITRPVRLAKLSLRVNDAGGGTVSLVNDTSWNQATITFANAPAIGSGVRTLPRSSRDGTIAADVTAAVNADADGVLSFALTTATAGVADYHSAEAGDAPRLVLVVDTPPVPLSPEALSGLALLLVGAASWRIARRRRAG